MKWILLCKIIKTGSMYHGFYTLRGRKFPHGNFRTSVFCEVKTQIVGKTKFFDSLKRKSAPIHPDGSAFALWIIEKREIY
mgnify:CR=1 FL=1